MTIFGGEGCRHAHDEVVELASRLNAPVGYSFRGKQWLEHDNPFAVGMTGLLGYGGAYNAMHDADLVLLLGTDFPFSEFLPGDSVKKVQIDINATHLGRRTALDLALVADVKETVNLLLRALAQRTARHFLEKYLKQTDRFHGLLQHYVDKGPGLKPIRPEFLAATLSDVAAPDAMFFIDTGTACMWGADTCGAGGIAESSARSPGRPWPTPRPMRLAPNWHSQAGRLSRYAAMGDSACSRLAT